MTNKTFIYETPDPDSDGIETGEIEAPDLEAVQRLLRIKFCRGSLPAGTIIKEKSIIQEQEKQVKSGKARHLLETLTSHYQWQRGEDEGRRADLRGKDLSNLNLIDKDFSDADLSGADLSGSDLTNANFRGANLSNAVLRDTILTSANLQLADLSDADLRGAVLTGAKLTSADLWRANLKGSIISPHTLHEALGCKHPEEEKTEAA